MTVTRAVLAAAQGKTLEDWPQAFELAELERLIEAHGPIRVLVHLEDFHGWTAGALWDELRFDLEHFRDIDRLAVVGDSSWERGLAAFAKPFTAAEVRFFDRADYGKAERWLSS